MSSVPENEILIDIIKKIDLIQTIVNKCAEFAQKPFRFQSVLDASIFFTNVTKDAIENAMENPNSKVLQKLLINHEEKRTNIEAAEIQSNNIHNILYDYYVVKRKLHLNLYELKKTLEAFNIYDLQLEIIRSKGFIWRKLSGDKCILIEDPEVQAKRIKYLLDVKKFRNQKRTFVYIEEKVIPADATSLHQFQADNHFIKSGTYQKIRIAASPQIGLISLSTKNNSGTSMSDWIENEVAPHLKSSFVVVFKENMIKEARFNEPPKPESKKEDMIKWLDFNNIPYTPTMHRAELYELIDICRDKLNDKRCLTEELFKGKGVDVLKIPEGWPMLNYFEPLWYTKGLWKNTADIADVIVKRVEITVSVYSASTWENFLHDLEVLETSVFEKDMELEEVIDKVLTMARDVDMSEADLSYVSEVMPSGTDKTLSAFSDTL